MARLGYLAAACLLAAVFFSLSAWQYGRGEQKQHLLEDWQSALAQPPIDMSAALRGNTPVPVADRFVPDPAAGWILLDNQRRGREVGLKAYRVLRSAEGVRLLADFGWLPWPSRAQLPILAEPEALLSTGGLWVDWPGQGIALAPNPLDEGRRGEPVLLAYLDRVEIESWIGQKLAPGVLRIAPDATFGFVRELEALPNTLPPEKHFGYALQWFGFGITVLVVTFVLMWKNRSRSRDSEQ